MADCIINGMTMGLLRISSIMHVVCVCMYVCMYVSMYYVCMCVWVCMHTCGHGERGGGAESPHGLCCILHNANLSQNLQCCVSMYGVCVEVAYLCVVCMFVCVHVTVCACFLFVEARDVWWHFENVSQTVTILSLCVCMCVSVCQSVCRLSY